MFVFPQSVVAVDMYILKSYLAEQDQGLPDEQGNTYKKCSNLVFRVKMICGDPQLKN